jgi:hypothetical protein
MKLLHLQHAGEGGDAEKGGGSVRNFFSLHRHKNNKHQHDDGGADVFDVDFT